MEETEQKKGMRYAIIVYVVFGIFCKRIRREFGIFVFKFYNKKLKFLVK